MPRQWAASLASVQAKLPHRTNINMLQFDEIVIMEAWQRLLLLGSEGITCDMQTGHVIGLNLTNSCLYGCINSINAAFQLTHLTSLDLSMNNFILCFISNRLGDLSKLTHLNLSFSWFAGEMPMEISSLSQLVSLDFSGNDHLSLSSDSLSSLAQNLTKLRGLHLNKVNVSSPMLDALSNFTSLNSLQLRSAQLIPGAVFMLPNLEVLDLMYNENLRCYLPEFPAKSSPLKKPTLASTSFCGELPESIANLGSLQVVDIGNCSFNGWIPSSIAKLTKLSKLVHARNHFQGHIPPSLENLTSSQTCHSHTMISAPWKACLGWGIKLTELKCLYLAVVNLYGHIPSVLSKLVNIERLHLNYN